MCWYHIDHEFQLMVNYIVIIVDVMVSYTGIVEFSKLGSCPTPIHPYLMDPHHQMTSSRPQIQLQTQLGLLLLDPSIHPGE